MTHCMRLPRTNGGRHPSFLGRCFGGLSEWPIARSIHGSRGTSTALFKPVPEVRTEAVPIVYGVQPLSARIELTGVCTQDRSFNMDVGDATLSRGLP